MSNPRIINLIKSNPVIGRRKQVTRCRTVLTVLAPLRNIAEMNNTPIGKISRIILLCWHLPNPMLRTPLEEFLPQSVVELRIRLSAQQPLTARIVLDQFQRLNDQRGSLTIREPTTKYLHLRSAQLEAVLHTTLDQSIIRH